MPRRLPVASPPPLPERSGRGKPLLDLEISVVTPLFGGSPTAGVVDPERPITGQTVRGHLRFWWRACNASRFTTAEEMFANEARLWGSVGGSEEPVPSSLNVRVRLLDSGRHVNLREKDNRSRPVWRRGYPSYALFPFQESNDKPVADACLTGVRFQLTVSAAMHITSDQASGLVKEIESAVWAWITFGGIGARTRRGCGSLWCTDANFQPPSDTRRIASWLQDRAGRHVAGGSGSGLQPSLSGARFVVDEQTGGHIEAWQETVCVMADLRQKTGFARNPGQGNRPGRSRWPEPDTLRDILNIDDRRHKPEHPARPSFPRADLGLPIVFQQMQGSPTLGPSEESTRMASPVILKPLAIAQDRSVPLVLVLNAPHVWDNGTPELMLKQGQRSRKIGRDMLQLGDRSRDVHPLHNERYKVTNARDAVLALAASLWKTRVEEL